MTFGAPDPVVGLTRTEFTGEVLHISRTANGRCDNLLTATIICAHVPVILAPNMNALMWSNPAIGRNLDTIRTDGHTVLDMEPATAYAFGTRSASDSLAMARPSTVERALRVATGLPVPDAAASGQ